MNRFQANICLIVVTLLWSSEVVIFSVIPSDVPSWATMCVTSIIGAALLWACFGKRILQALRSEGRALVRHAALLSALNVTYNAFMITGLSYFDVTTGAFTISLTMVFLPFVQLVMRRRVPARTWITAFLVLAGVATGIGPTMGVQQLPGLGIMLISCTLRGAYIVKLNDFARGHDPVALSVGMVSFNAVFAFVMWFVVQPSTFAAMPWTPPVIAALFVYAYFVVAFVSVINNYAQRRTTAAEAAIIFSTEIVFSVLWGTILPPDIVDPTPLTLTTVAGCALIVLGNIVEILQVGPAKRDSADAEAKEDGSDDGARVAPSHPQPAAGADTVSAGLARMRSPFVRKFALFAVLLMVYLVVAIPFKVLVVIPGFADVRPVAMLQPVYGIFFGVPGCFAFAVGNLIGDIVSDSLRLSSIAGFTGSFVGTYLMYVFWARFRKGAFDVRSWRSFAAFCLTIVASAVVQALIISADVAYFYPEVDVVLFAVSVIANSVAFPIALATPFIALIQDELGFKPVSAPFRARLR